MIPFLCIQTMNIGSLNTYKNDISSGEIYLCQQELEQSDVYVATLQVYSKYNYIICRVSHMTATLQFVTLHFRLYITN